MVPALSVFIASLFGIFALLSIKAWELRRERVLFPNVRALLDRFALVCKSVILALENVLAQLPSLTSALMFKILGGGAVGFARAASAASDAANRLADLVSHKRNFQKRDTKSEFLKQVIEHKSLNGASTKKPGEY